MEIQMTVNAPRDFMFDQIMKSVLYDIKQATGRDYTEHELAHLHYRKKFGNGQAGEITVKQLTHNVVYGYEMSAPRNHYYVEYRLAGTDDGNTQLAYTEKVIGDKKMTDANNMIGIFLLGWQRKRNFKKMMRQMETLYHQDGQSK